MDPPKRWKCVKHGRESGCWLVWVLSARLPNWCNERRIYSQSEAIGCVWSFTATPPGRDRFEMSLDTRLPLLPLLPAAAHPAATRASLCSCPCVITLPRRSPLSCHTSGCFLLSIFRFPSSPSHPSPCLFPSVPPTLRRVRC